MKIVILDGYALNPGDLNWDALRAFGNLTIYDRTDPADLLDRASGAAVLFTNKTLLNAGHLAQLQPHLKYVGLFSTGVNVIDLEAARSHGVTVTNIPAYSTDSVAQITMAHLLNLTFHLAPHAESVRAGHWSKNADFCYWLGPLTELAGRTFGSVGYGNIGKAACALAAAFKMNTIACRSTFQGESVTPEGTRMVDLDTLLKESDVVSLHCPLTATNRHLMDAAGIAKMKEGAFFINTARGPLVDEVALADALNEGRIAGAGLDVLAQEPPALGNPLLTARNCFITPHIAWGTLAARTRLMQIAVANLQSFLNGNSQNVVN